MNANKKQDNRQINKTNFLPQPVISIFEKKNVLPLIDQLYFFYLENFTQNSNQNDNSEFEYVANNSKTDKQTNKDNKNLVKNNQNISDQVNKKYSKKRFDYPQKQEKFQDKIKRQSTQNNQKRICKSFQPPIKYDPVPKKKQQNKFNILLKRDQVAEPTKKQYNPEQDMNRSMVRRLSKDKVSLEGSRNNMNDYIKGKKK